MFQPPSIVELLADAPKPRPVYDIPPVLVRRRPLRDLVARLAARRGETTSPRQSCPCPEPSAESSF